LYSLNQDASIPACNSYQNNEKKCEKDTAAAPLDYDLHRGTLYNNLNAGSSIPACNSYQYNEKKCEKDTAAAPLPYDLHKGILYSLNEDASKSIPACNSYQYKEGKCEKDTAAAPTGALPLYSLDQSIPACTSFECMKRDQSQVIDKDALAQTDRWGSLAMKSTSSDPICSSAGCPDSWKGTDAMKIVEYPVTHGYALDDDIITSQGHMNTLEKQYGVWKVPQGKK